MIIMLQVLSTLFSDGEKTDEISLLFVVYFLLHLLVRRLVMVRSHRRVTFAHMKGVRKGCPPRGVFFCFHRFSISIHSLSQFILPPPSSSSSFFPTYFLLLFLLLFLSLFLLFLLLFCYFYFCFFFCFIFCFFFFFFFILFISQQ